jgi:hypothetical protein
MGAPAGVFGCRAWYAERLADLMNAGHTNPKCAWHLAFGGQQGSCSMGSELKFSAATQANWPGLPGLQGEMAPTPLVGETSAVEKKASNRECYAAIGVGGEGEIHPSSVAFALASCQARARKWMSWIGARSSPRTWNSLKPVSVRQYLTMSLVPSKVTTTPLSAASTRNFKLSVLVIGGPRHLRR